MKLILLLALAAVLLSGCGTINQEIMNELRHPDGTVEIRRTKNVIRVTGDSKQVVDTVKISNGAKSQSIGAHGVDQESQSPLKDLIELTKELKTP